MNKVWLVGASGMLGHAVAAELKSLGVDFVGTDHALDISDEKRIFQFGESGRFSHVINCAAFTDVDGAESNEKLAFEVNAIGAGNIAHLASRIGAVAIHVSTDYAFDGESSTPYREDFPPNPIGAYARSKVAGEEAFVAAAPGGIIVRTSWLFGVAGKNFVATMLRLMSERDEVAVVSDQRGRPTCTTDLAAALVSLTGLRPGHAPSAPGLYHFANSGETSWYEFASAIMRKAQMRPSMNIRCNHVRVIASSDYPTKVRRPKYSVLDTTKIADALAAAPRSWSDALDDYLSVLTGDLQPKV